jgi:hypothetical protein
MWGAFPGEPLENVESGIGAVGNALLFDRVQARACACSSAPLQRSLMRRRRRRRWANDAWVAR